MVQHHHLYSITWFTLWTSLQVYPSNNNKYVSAVLLIILPELWMWSHFQSSIGIPDWSDDPVLETANLCAKLHSTNTIILYRSWRWLHICFVFFPVNFGANFVHPMQQVYQLYASFSTIAVMSVRNIINVERCTRTIQSVGTHYT